MLFTTREIEVRNGVAKAGSLPNQATGQAFTHAPGALSREPIKTYNPMA